MKKIIFVLLAFILLLQFSSCKDKKESVSSRITSFESSSVSSVSSVLQSSDIEEVSSQTSVSSEGQVSSSFEVGNSESIITSSRRVFGQNIEGQMEAPYITAEKLKSVTDKMTYKEIFALLGSPKRVADSNYAQYIVDNTKLLMFNFESEDDVCALSGEELLSKCVDFSSFYYDSKEGIADAVVSHILKLNDGRRAVVVSSPEYNGYWFANIVLSKNDSEILKLEVGDIIRIKHDFPILESYPCQITALDIKIIKRK